MALDQVVQREWVPQPSDLRLVHGALHLAPGLNRGEVEDRAWDSGDGDAAERCELVCGQAGAVELDTRPGPRSSWDGHLDSSSVRPQEPILGTGVPVAQDGALTAGQDGRHPLPVQGEHRMADRIAAAVDHVKAAATKPVCTRVAEE